MNTALCSTSDIPDTGSKAFQLDHNNEVLNIFVIHKDGEFHAFINSCPHTGVNFEWQEDQFLDADQAFIQCASHGALFEIETGHCIHGPCVGDHLSPRNLKIIDNRVILKI